ncbi:MAG: DUF805 domain-containing protein [Gordonia sp. (in: high G+C Gram-positive bacteria)]|uniref:DUF805 domain-containing protein n=1 Tax=Gordonia sp. (in: high G+C Gram-positive bacteria) TaxID=84139 RepID=UPI003BB69046
MTTTPAPAAPPIDWPYYGIGPAGAVKRVFRKYATFTGRASRGEYWWWILFHGIVDAILLGLAYTVGVNWHIVGDDDAIGEFTAFGIIALIVFVIWALATIVPTIAVTVRRLHDAGFSGWFYLLTLVGPLSIVVFIMCLIATSPNAVRYGPPAPAGYAPPVYPQNPQA